jgi:hypothetical protein
MAKASTKKQKIRRLQPADFPRPKRLSQENVSEICEGLHISDRHAAELKDYLDELVEYVSEWMSRKKAANRQADRGRIKKMHAQIVAALGELNELGIDGRLAVRSVAGRVADILSGGWLRYHFPGHAPSRPTGSGRPDPREDPREPSHDETYSNYQFIRYRAPETLQALLRDLASALTSALTSIESDPRTRGGQQPLEFRNDVVVNLANTWHRIGKRPVGTRHSDFAVFCESVFEATGWLTVGLDSAIPDAINDWRNRQENPVRLSK